MTKYPTRMEEQKISLAGEIAMGCILYGLIMPTLYTMAAIDWCVGPCEDEPGEESSLWGELYKLFSRESPKEEAPVNGLALAE